jgi:hypothetical protein
VNVEVGLAPASGLEPDVDPPPLDDELHPDSSNPATRAATHSRDREPVVPIPQSRVCAICAKSSIVPTNIHSLVQGRSVARAA